MHQRWGFRSVQHTRTTPLHENCSDCISTCSGIPSCSLGRQQFPEPFQCKYVLVIVQEHTKYHYPSHFSDKGHELVLMPTYCMTILWSTIEKYIKSVLHRPKQDGYLCERAAKVKQPLAATGVQIFQQQRQFCEQTGPWSTPPMITVKYLLYLCCWGSSSDGRPLPWDERIIMLTLK